VLLPLVLLAAVIGGSGALAPAPARAQTSGEAERYFRVEWSPDAVPRGGWAVEGFVYSSHPYRVNGVRLAVDVLDESGQVKKRAFGWVPGDVPSGGRAYFFVSIPERGTTYRVRVLSFFLVARESP
jgi:hypothetical protein